MNERELLFLIIGFGLGGMTIFYLYRKQLEDAILHLGNRQKQLWMDLSEWRDRSQRLAAEILIAERHGHIHKLLLDKAREAESRAKSDIFKERENDSAIFRL